MAGDPTQGTWYPDVTFDNGVGGSFSAASTGGPGPGMMWDGYKWTNQQQTQANAQFGPQQVIQDIYNPTNPAIGFANNSNIGSNGQVVSEQQQTIGNITPVRLDYGQAQTQYGDGNYSGDPLGTYKALAFGNSGQITAPDTINQIYQQFLGRDADPDAMSYYGGWDPQAIQNALQASPEFQQNQNPYGGLVSGADGNPTYGDLSNSGQFSVNPGGDYNDNFNAPYNPAGGGGLSSDEVASLYQQFLGRSPTQEDLSYYSQGWDPQSLTNALNASGEHYDFAQRGATMPTDLNPAGGAQIASTDINALFHDYLGRDADAGALSYYGGWDPTAIRNALQASPEYQQSHNPYGELVTGADGNPTYGDLSGAQVSAPEKPSGPFPGTTAGLSMDTLSQLYQQFLGRAPDAGAASYYGGWDADAVRNALQASPEYAQSHPANFDVNGPVGQGGDLSHLNSLYQQFLGRDADPSGASYYAGQSDDQIARALQGSQEYQQHLASGGAGLDANGQPTYAGNWPNVAFNGSQNTKPYLDGLDYGALGLDEGDFTGNSRPWESSLADNLPANPLARAYQLYQPFLGKYGAEAALANSSVEDPGQNPAQMQMSSKGTPYYNKDGVPLGLGLYQWSPDRQQGLNDFADFYKISPTDYDTQLRYSLYEMLHNYAPTVRSIRNAPDLASAIKSFETGYEGASRPDMNRRISNGQAIDYFVNNNFQIGEGDPYWEQYRQVIKPLGGDINNPYNVPLPPTIPTQTYPE